jgi:hypothetical protein
MWDELPGVAPLPAFNQCFGSYSSLAQYEIVRRFTRRKTPIDSKRNILLAIIVLAGFFIAGIQIPAVLAMGQAAGTKQLISSSHSNAMGDDCARRTIYCLSTCCFLPLSLLK